MGTETHIAWCDSTFNPWVGCQKVSPACDHCYAERWDARFSGGASRHWGPDAPRRRTSAANWRLPIRWNAQRFMQCSACGWRGECAAELIGCGHCGSIDSIKDARRRVFCASLCDVFDPAAPDEWRNDLWELVLSTPHLDWLLLTKRIGNVKRMLPWAVTAECPVPSNVWLGITVANQEEVERDVPKLVAVPAAKRFVSIEPMLGLVDLVQIGGDAFNRRGTLDAVRGRRSVYIGADEDGRAMWGDAQTERLDWVIVGGESGSDARPMSPDWALSIRDQCEQAGVPFFFKQWGSWAPMVGHTGGARVSETRTLEDGHVVGYVGRQAAPALLSGRSHREWAA